MKVKEKILIAGGDLRQIYCAQRLSDKYDTAIIGFDEKNVIMTGKKLKYANLDDIAVYDYAVLPVISLSEENMLNTPCCDKKISIEQIKQMIKPDGIIFAGKTEKNIYTHFDKMKIYDYLSREDLSLLNAIPTAEGAVQIAMEELPITLNGLKVLIVGCGRIGTALTQILKGFGADITISVRNAKSAAKAKILGVKSCCTNKLSADYSLIFNTVPEMIFNKELLKEFGRETLFIDLASKPGGIDFESATELGLRAIWALGLPGKTAPITSGEIIADTISGILSERGEADGG